MLRFFRSIRKQLLSENKLSKYFLYAIGEIILVVLGIIIALQLNIWNEHRKEYNQIENFAVSLSQDLKKDVEMIKIIENAAIQIVVRIDSLSNYVRSKEIEDISNLNLLSLTWIQVYRPYSWNRATIEELKSSGSLRLVRNKDLLRKIVEYDAFTRHMDEDYYTDKTQGEDALRLLSHVVNNNYPNIDSLSEVFRVSTNYGDLGDIYSDSHYQDAEKFEIDLITDDINAIHKAINSYNRLKFNLKIRTEIELPELIIDAEELIALLKLEYGF